jgi:hypothetical protein
VVVVDVVVVVVDVVVVGAVLVVAMLAAGVVVVVSLSEALGALCVRVVGAEPTVVVGAGTGFASVTSRRGPVGARAVT